MNQKAKERAGGGANKDRGESQRAGVSVQTRDVADQVERRASGKEREISQKRPHFPFPSFRYFSFIPSCPALNPTRWTLCPHIAKKIKKKRLFVNHQQGQDWNFHADW